MPAIELPARPVEFNALVIAPIGEFPAKLLRILDASLKPCKAL